MMNLCMFVANSVLSIIINEFMFALQLLCVFAFFFFFLNE